MPKTLPARVVFFTALAVGAALRLNAVFGDDGIYWPDEIYQSFEPAHRLVFGYGLVAWEFIDGARNWALPGLVALVLKACAVLGLDRPTAYIPAVKLVFTAMSLAAAWGAYRLARTLGAEELPAATAAALFALCAPAVYFAPRAMSENTSALPVVWGLALLLQKDASRRALLFGASLLGLAALFRLHAGVFCVGALAILAARKQWKPARDVALVLLAWAVAYGALDAATWNAAPGVKWGGWFHSAVVYLRFNLIEGKAAAWGTAPWSYYLKHSFTSMPGVAVVLAAGTVLAFKRAPGVALTALAFFALHSWVAHKELRFLVPVLPVFCALAGVGITALVATPVPLFRRAAVPVALLAALVSAATHRALTFGDLGAYAERPQSSAWDDFGPVNRLLLAASRQPELCGLRIDVAHLAWTGGSTYLHRDAPLYMGNTPHTLGLFNYVLTRPGSGATVVAKEAGLELVRLPLAACQVDSRYTWRLP